MVAINYAKDIRVGEQPVKAAALGSNFVWPPLPERLFFRGQSLVYDFVRQRYGVRLPDGTIVYTTNVNDLGILTRASTATYWGPEGSLLEAAVDEARIQHDPVTGEPLGLLVEREATNSLYPSTYSNFRGQYQTENNITVTKDAAQAPDGTQTAVLVEASDVGGVDELSFRWAHSGQGFARSVFIKPVGNIKVIETRVSRSRPWIAYNVETGETSYSNDFITHFGREPIVEASKSGWIRLEGMTRNPDAGGYWSMVYARPLEGELSEGDGVLVWGTQDEAWDWEGQKPFTSYIPAIDSPVTRAADYATIDLSDVLNPDEGTYVVRAVVKDDGDTEYYAGHYNPGPTSPRISMIRDSDGRFRLQVGSSNRVFDPPSTLKSGDVVTLAASYVVGEEETTYTMSSSGNVSSGTSNYIPENTVNLVRGVGPSLGDNNASLESSGIIAGFEYYPRALTEEELARITAFTSGDNS